MEFLSDVEFAPKNRRRGVPRKNMERLSGQRRGVDREFIAWDGEGWTDHVCADSSRCENHSGKCKHHYYLFGSSDGAYVSGESLSTVQCLDLLVSAKARNPDALHVSFSFKYDIDMILGDVHPAAMRYLMKNNKMKWRGYWLEVLPGKWFQVSKDGIGIRVYDLFSFFASSFVTALRKWNVGTPQQVERIASTKAERSGFTLESLEEQVIPYWREELELLAALAEQLREVLYSAGIKPSMWHGPGAVANFLFKHYKAGMCMPDYNSIPEGVKDASQFAYAGGRFEAFRIGFYDGPIFSADINSAYPYAMSLLPDMASGVWIYSRSFSGLSELEDIRVGLFHVRYRYRDEWRRAIAYDGFPGAAHYRYHTSNTVHYRHENPGVWIHLPEFRNLLDQFQAGMFREFEVVESWIYLDDGSYPFSWVAEIYEQRKRWKAEGNAAQLAAKVGLSSLYGKLAQRIGGKESKPTWHNLEMAGHITSHCRAMLYAASWRQHSSLVAYQTDGIYSTTPMASLPNGAGDQLGQWETVQYSGMLHLQSGVYWLRDMEGNWLRPKSRGVPQQHMDFEKAFEALRAGTPLTVVQTQFIRFGFANMRRSGMKNWRTWQINEKEFSFGGEGMGSAGKRIHIPESCKECVQGYGYDEALHTLMLSPKGFPWRNGHKLESAAHYLPWRNVGQEPADFRDLPMKENWGYLDQ